MYIYPVVFVSLCVSNCAKFCIYLILIHSLSFSPTHCPRTLNLVNWIHLHISLTVFWLSQANGSHCQTVVEQKKTLYFLLLLPFFLQGFWKYLYASWPLLQNSSSQWTLVHARVFSALGMVMVFHFSYGYLTIANLSPYLRPLLCNWGSFVSLLIEIFVFPYGTLVNALMKWESKIIQ